MTPQLALRVAIVGSFALAMFAIIFFRLWFLQVLSGNQYQSAAEVNNVRHDPDRRPRAARSSTRNGRRAGRLGARPRRSRSPPTTLPVPVTSANMPQTQPPARTCALYDRLATLLSDLATKPAPVLRRSTTRTADAARSTHPTAVADRVRGRPAGVAPCRTAT